MMKKVLCLALVGSLMCAVGANAQTTVEIELKSDTADQYWIEATITGGDLSEGLALWGADVNFTTVVGPPSPMANPGGDLAQFEVLLGLNNPDGYGGTVSGDNLLQVGGASNTINNDAGNAPYPIGTPPLGVGDTTITVATGACSTADGDTMTLENCFANVIVDGETGPVYAVSAATVTCTGTAVPCFGGGPTPTLLTVESVMYHKSFNDNGIPPGSDGIAYPGGDEGLLAYDSASPPITGLTEPRNQYDGTAPPGSEYTYLNLVYDGAVDAGTVTVAIDAVGVNGLVAAGASASEVEVQWVDAVVNPVSVPDGSYQITVTTGAGAPVVFPMCYNNGDVFCNDGVVTGADAAAISNPANWNHDLTTAVGPTGNDTSPVRVDLTRDGVVTGADAAVVANAQNWTAASGITVTCGCN